MSQIINLEISCYGDFIIDENGIRSVNPVAIKSKGWNNNIWNDRTYKLKCHNIDSINSINNTEIIDEQIPHKYIKTIISTGSSNNIINTPLDSHSYLIMNGSGSININSNNPNTECNAVINGSGKITGYKSLYSINAFVNGSGSISGFKVHNFINASLKGSGHIYLKSPKGCLINKKVIGPETGNINISE